MSDHSINPVETEVATVSVSKRRVTVVVCALVVATIGVVWFVANGEAEVPPDTPPRVMPVYASPVELLHSYSISRTFTGTVVARRSSELAFERTAKLVAVLHEEGDRVLQGQELARLDQRLLQKQQLELMARKRAADARLSELVNGIRPEIKEAAHADLAALTAQFDLDLLAFERQVELKTSGATTSDEFDRVRLTLAASKARRDAAQQRLNEILAGARKERIDEQRAITEELDALLASVAVQIEQSTLIAPFAGTIVARHLDEGAIASPQQPILRLVEDGQTEIRIGLPTEFVDAVSAGSTHQVVIGGSPIAAKVSSVLPEVDHTTRTRIALLLPVPRLSEKPNEKPVEIVDGQLARIELKQSIEQDGFWLPMTALTRSTRGLWSVYAVVIQDGAAKRQDAKQQHAEQQIAERREVEVLHTTGNRVFVRGTLKHGDNIITSGLQRIVPGQLVSATQPDESSQLRSE